jgi:hypothetical protein
MSTLRQCPPIPPGYVDEYRRHLVEYPHFTETDDELFDHVLDFVMGHDAAPRDADGDGDVECMREWTYEIMEAIGRKYGTNPRGGGLLQWVAGLALAAVGVGGIVGGLRARAARRA